MLRTVNGQPTSRESLFPEMCLGLPAELEAVDRLLDDPVFFAPLREALRSAVGAAVGADRDLPAAHVLEVPLQARFRADLP